MCVFFGPFGFPGAPVHRLCGLWGLEVEPNWSQVGRMPFYFSLLSSHTRGFWQLSGPIGAQVVHWACQCLQDLLLFWCLSALSFLAGLFFDSSAQNLQACGVIRQRQSAARSRCV